MPATAASPGRRHRPQIQQQELAWNPQAFPNPLPKRPRRLGGDLRRSGRQVADFFRPKKESKQNFQPGWAGISWSGALSQKPLHSYSRASRWILPHWKENRLCHRDDPWDRPRACSAMAWCHPMRTQVDARRELKKPQTAQPWQEPSFQDAAGTASLKLPAPRWQPALKQKQCQQ